MVDIFNITHFSLGKQLIYAPMLTILLTLKEPCGVHIVFKLHEVSEPKVLWLLSEEEGWSDS